MDNLYNAVVEDQLTEVVLHKISNDNNAFIANVYGLRGNSYIKKNLKKFYNASKQFPYLIITDLDRSSCPVKLLSDWEVPRKEDNFSFRIAVKEIEAWLMSDKDNFARFLGISKSLIPFDIESVEDPKQLLINLAKRSRKRSISEAIIPIDEFTSIGPGYNEILGEFVIKSWSYTDASENSISLKKLVEVIKKFGNTQKF